MEEPPAFPSFDPLKRLWWLHDSFWHAALIRDLGVAEANRLNLEVTEKIFRMVTNALLREGMVERPRDIQSLMGVFRAVWKNAFFDDLYVHDPVRFEGDTAVWRGTRCHAYESLKKAGLLEGYACGCQGLRNGVMKALRLEPLHEIEKSLVAGDDCCVIRVTFAPVRR